MSEIPQFIYKEEFWFISAFVNASKINPKLKSKEIENLIKNKFKNLKDEDIYKKELKEDLFELISNISIKCSWVTCLSNFPYKDENSEIDYNSLGYFQFEVEYYKDNPSKKESLKPMLIQQVLFILLKTLKDFKNNAENA